jgi:hypothetical protein
MMVLYQGHWRYNGSEAMPSEQHEPLLAKTARSDKEFPGAQGFS